MKALNFHDQKSFLRIDAETLCHKLTVSKKYTKLNLKIKEKILKKNCIKKPCYLSTYPLVFSSNVTDERSPYTLYAIYTIQTFSYKKRINETIFSTLLKLNFFINPQPISTN